MKEEKERPLNNKLIAIVRVRGTVNVRSDITETLKRLNLKHPNNCTVVRLTDTYHGMLVKVNNHVAFGEIDEPTLIKLIEKRGVSRVADKLKALPAAEIAKRFEAGKIKLSDDEIKLDPVFKLHPPRHGYRSTKLQVKQGGSLGYQGAKINELISRMV